MTPDQKARYYGTSNTSGDVSSSIHKSPDQALASQTAGRTLRLPAVLGVFFL
jgi:hypothetical protein